MDSRQLRYFVAIHEHGTLTAAAENERIAASALSYHLGNLEQELGTPLFTRKPRGMAPTAAGAQLYSSACAILASIEEAAQRVKGAHTGISGDVTIGMAYSATKAIGVDLARHVLENHPRVRLQLSESLSGSTLLHLLNSEVDLALVYNPPVAASLSARPILEERMVCLGLPELIGDTDKPITVAELMELPLVLLRQGLSARAIMDDWALLKKLEARARLQMNSVQAIAGVLLEGLGCAIGTALFMSEHVESGRLAAREIIEPELSRKLCLCEIEGRTPGPAFEMVRDLILKLVKDTVEDGRWPARLL